MRENFVALMEPVELHVIRVMDSRATMEEHALYVITSPFVVVPWNMAQTIARKVYLK